MTALHIGLLVLGGLLAGTVNVFAGAGSLITVPLLVLAGLPGNVANGTNRIGILAGTLVAIWRFRAEGLSGVRSALPMLVPVAMGSFIGASAISLVSDTTFERLFGIVMVVLLIPVLRVTATPQREATPLSPSQLLLLFFAIGIYGGAFQAGVGIAILFGLSYAGHDLVRGNSIKVVINAVQTLFAVPAFVMRNQVAWEPAAVLAVGLMLGSAAGVRLTVWGGERVIRPVLALAVLALAGRMMGMY